MTLMTDPIAQRALYAPGLSIDDRMRLRVEFLEKNSILDLSPWARALYDVAAAQVTAARATGFPPPPPPPPGLKWP